MRLHHPVTVYPAAIAVLGAVAAYVFDPTLITLGAAIGGALLATGSFLANLFLFSGSVAEKHFQIVFNNLEERKRELLDKIKAELGELQDGLSDELRQHASQGHSQYRMVKERFGTVKNILDQKLHSGELTYGRYIAAAEHVYLSVLDNLAIVVSQCRSLQSIDLHYIETRMSSLSALNNPTDADWKEVKALEERRSLQQQQIEQINRLLSENEIAITEMDKLNAAVAQVKLSRGAKSSRDIDAAIEEMEELAKRVHEYAKV